MGDKEIKGILKEARQNIKDKDYKAALKEVKKVLNKDKNNYMALVFCGVCLVELEQPEQAIQAYKRATEASPEQEIAWEGLSKFYDKNIENKEYITDHISVLKTLLSLVKNDDTKRYDLSSKLCQLQLNNQDFQAAVSTLHSETQTIQDQNLTRSLQEKIVKILSQQTEVPNDLQGIYKLSLETLLHENATIENMENYKHIIKLMHEMRNLTDTVERCVEMTLIFPENIYPLEWICKAYLESTILKADFQSEVLKDPSCYIEKLVQFSTKNLYGNLARGQNVIAKGNLDEGVAILSDQCKTNSPDPLGIFLLSRVQFKAGKFSAVEITVPEAIKALKKMKDENMRKKMKKELNLINLKSLYKQQQFEKLAELLKDVEGSVNDDDADPELHLILTKVSAVLGEKDKVEELMNKHQLNSADSCLVQALLCKSQGNVDDSSKLLEQSLLEDSSSSEALILLGQIMWDKDEKQQSLAFFLKAAKVDVTNWIPFLYLGHYYRSLQSSEGTDKARKCYQKCLALNPHNVEAGKALSDIYRETGQLQQNLQFLTEVTRKSLASSGKSTWAWLRLGVHYLASNEATSAVSALQSALRGDSADVNCWEALAEAYMTRGSFTAAQKSFEKVLDIDSDLVYARLMIASIKDRLGKWREASADFRELIEQDGDYLPALRGLGESLLSQARAFVQNFVDRNAVDCIEEALCVLTKAAELNPNMIGTWRLIGDCCSLVGELPESSVQLEVPAKLLGTGEGQMAANKDQLLDLGARAYVRGLNLDADNWKLWHQLASIYMMIAKKGNTRELSSKAVSILKHTVKLNPGDPFLWNSLGLAAIQVEDWPLAQHSLIKSLKLEPSSSAWTHLGVLYLHQGNINLANRALKEAQSCEPSYLRGWAGQAMVAEFAGFASESMDLFRHCTFLGGETESARGYANWALSTIRDMESGGKVEHHNRYILEKMQGLTVAGDSLTLFCRRNTKDALAFNQLSVILERQGLLNRALECAQQSAEILQQHDKPDLLNKVRGNIARLQCRVGEYSRSVESYQSMQTPTLHSTVGLALAQYMLGNYQESYEVYKSSLHWLVESQAAKSDILVAMGNLAYKVEGPEVAKTLLFQSCQMSPPSVRGILALCVLGIQSSDLGLIDAALAEMSVHANDPRFAHDIVYLQASVLLLKGDLKGARRLLLRAAHRMPWSSELWRDLAVFILHNCREEAAAAAKCARKAGLLFQGSGTDGGVKSGRYISKVKGLDDTGSCISLAESLVIESLCLLLAGDRCGCRRVTSKLCHLYPHLSHSWALLAATGDENSGWTTKVKSHLLACGDNTLESWAQCLP